MPSLKLCSSAFGILVCPPPQEILKHPQYFSKICASINVVAAAVVVIDVVVVKAITAIIVIYHIYSFISSSDRKSYNCHHSYIVISFIRLHWTFPLIFEMCHGFSFFKSGHPSTTTSISSNSFPTNCFFTPFFLMFYP